MSSFFFTLDVYSHCKLKKFEKLRNYKQMFNLFIKVKTHIYHSYFIVKDDLSFLWIIL